MPENQLIDFSKTYQTQTTVSGIFVSLLTVIFVVLKLDPGGHLTTAVTEWSWWWVFSPLWLPTAALLGLAAVIPVLVGIIAGIAAIFSR